MREADRMQNLLLTREALGNERRIVTEELRLAEENSRAGRLAAKLQLADTMLWSHGLLNSRLTMALRRAG